MSAQRQIETDDQIYTEAQYWELEANSPEKHEFIGSKITAMAGGTRNHTRICGNVFGAVNNLLRGKPCDVHTSEQKVKSERSGNTYYPDAVIFCPPSRWTGTGDHTLLTPTVIFEVLSPATERNDRGSKFRAYQQIESLTDYVLIEAEQISVDHYRRTPEGWLLRTYTKRGDVLSFPDLDIELPVADIYESLDVPEALYLISPDFSDDGKD